MAYGKRREKRGGGRRGVAEFGTPNMQA